MQIRKVVVQTLGPKETFVGQVAEGRYTWEDGIVTLVSRAGVPLRSRYGDTYKKRLTPQEDPHVIAGRLTKQRWHDQGRDKKKFSAPIHYPNLGLA